MKISKNNRTFIIEKKIVNHERVFVLYEEFRGAFSARYKNMLAFDVDKQKLIDHIDWLTSDE